jgi:hypothetical protein
MVLAATVKTYPHRCKAKLLASLKNIFWRFYLLHTYKLKPSITVIFTSVAIKESNGVKKADSIKRSDDLKYKLWFQQNSTISC